jgi:hypothetical protein
MTCLSCLSHDTYLLVEARNLVRQSKTLLYYNTIYTVSNVFTISIINLSIVRATKAQIDYRPGYPKYRAPKPV